MSGGQDEASERISTSDLPYWLARPISGLAMIVKELDGVLVKVLKRVEFLESTVKDLDSCFARLDEKYEELSQAVGRLEPPAEIPQAVRDMIEFGKITDEEMKASLDLLKSGRQSIPIPPAIQREVEEVIAERLGEQPPAKRREWWCVLQRNGSIESRGDQQTAIESARDSIVGVRAVRVIEAPSESEITGAVFDILNYRNMGGSLVEFANTAIRKLLGENTKDAQ